MAAKMAAKNTIYNRVELFFTYPMYPVNTNYTTYPNLSHFIQLIHLVHPIHPDEFILKFLCRNGRKGFCAIQGLSFHTNCYCTSSGSTRSGQAI